MATGDIFNAKALAADAFRNLELDAAIRLLVERGLDTGTLPDSTCEYLSHPLDRRVPDGAKLNV
jgi:hypothetical protein